MSLHRPLTNSILNLTPSWCILRDDQFSSWNICSLFASVIFCICRVLETSSTHPLAPCELAWTLFCCRELDVFSARCFYHPSKNELKLWKKRNFPNLKSLLSVWNPHVLISFRAAGWQRTNQGLLHIGTYTELCFWFVLNDAFLLITGVWWVLQGWDSSPSTFIYLNLILEACVITSFRLLLRRWIRSTFAFHCCSAAAVLLTTHSSGFIG